MFCGFLMFTKGCFAFCHSVASFHFVKQLRVKIYSLSLFLFNAELGFIEINVSQTRNPIPPKLKSIQVKFFETKFFSFISLQEFLLLRNVTKQWPSLFHQSLLFSEFRQKSDYLYHQSISNHAMFNLKI